MTFTSKLHPPEYLQAINHRHAASRQALKQHLGRAPDLDEAQQPNHMVVIAEEGKHVPISTSIDIDLAWIHLEEQGEIFRQNRVHPAAALTSELRTERQSWKPDLLLTPHVTSPNIYLVKATTRADE